MERAMVVAVAMGLTACGTAVECGPSNCLGCCTASGLCDSGASQTACGAGGSRCDVCAGGQTCSALGTCTFSNSGSGGGSGATGGGSGATGGGNEGLDPTSRWRVQPTQASVKSTNNGASWDALNGAPDPKVYLRCPATAASSTHSTPEEADTYYPTWSTGGCDMTAGDLQQLGFGFQVVDVDVSSDDPITQWYVVKPNASAFTAGGFSFGDTDGLSSIQFSLSRR